jgi:hypothetical protein
VAVRPPFLDKTGWKPAEKIIYGKHGFLNEIWHFWSDCCVKVS